MRTSTVCCARTPNLEIAFFSGDFLPAGGAFPWRRQDGVPKGRKGLASPSGRMCALCRQPRCGFCAHMSLAILHLQRKIADRSTSIHLCKTGGRAGGDEGKSQSQIQGGVSATQGKRRLRSRFLTAMSKTAVHGARTPYHGDAHIAPFTPPRYAPSSRQGAICKYLAKPNTVLKTPVAPLQSFL